MRRILRIIALFVLMSLILSTFAIKPTVPTLANPQKQNAQDGTWVYWDEGTWNESASWSWTDAMWEFGPQPRIEIYQDDVELVEFRNGELDINNIVEFRLIVPNNTFTEGSNFGGFELYMDTWSINGSAGLTLRYNESTGDYDLWQWMWTNFQPETGTTFQELQNELQNTKVSDVETGKTQAPTSFSYQQAQQDFFTLDNITISYNNSVQEIYCSVFGVFTSDSPEGNWHGGGMALDDKGRGIRSGWRTGQSSTEFTFIIGKGEGFVLELLDAYGEPTWAVAPDESVTIRLNVTRQLQSAFISLGGYIGPDDGYGGHAWGNLWFIFSSTGVEIAGTYYDWVLNQEVWTNTTAQQAFVKTSHTIATSPSNGWYVYSVTGSFSSMLIDEWSREFSGNLQVWNITDSAGNWVDAYRGNWDYDHWEFSLAEELLSIWILDQNGDPFNDDPWMPPKVDTTDFFTIKLMYIGNESQFSRFETAGVFFEIWDYDPLTNFEIHTKLEFTYNLTSHETSSTTIRAYNNYTAGDEYWNALITIGSLIDWYSYQINMTAVNLLNQTLNGRLRWDESITDPWDRIFDMERKYHETYVYWNETVTWISWDAFQTYDVTSKTIGDLKTVFEFNFTLANAPSGDYYGSAGLVSWEYDPWWTYINWTESLLNSIDLIIGESEWWNYNGYEVAENGALDLDGDLTTTEDQYYVLNTWESNDSWTVEDHYGDVSIYWDPIASNIGDELTMHNWAGITTLTWSYEWADNFYWYHADDRSLVSATEIQTINGTVWGPADLSDQWQQEYDEPATGYWDIAWLLRNVSSSDPEFEDWWWMDNVEISWFYFDAEQHYFTGMSEIDLQAVMTYIGLYGFLLYNDSDRNNILTIAADAFGQLTSDELTHFVVFQSAALTIVNPTYIDGTNTGSVPKASDTFLGPEAEISWAIRLDNVNATIFPANVYGQYYSMWDWYGGQVDTTTINTFFTGPTEAQIERIEWTFHFQGHTTATKSTDTTNRVDLKVDQYIADFENLTQGGIRLSKRAIERDVFNTTAYLAGEMTDYTGLSLAIGYDTAIFDISAVFVDEQSNQYSNQATVKNATASNNFTYSSAGTELAKFQMGGTNYIWGVDDSTQTAYSQVLPVDAFSALFTHQSEGSHTQISLNGTRYFMSSNFPKWGGHSIDNDPMFSAISSSGYKRGDSITTTEPGPTGTETRPSSTRPTPGFVMVMVILALGILPVIQWSRKWKK
ncbi:MAG: hypothetical protein ACFFBD_08755 [Candidatus Hodarchaeota archaeon]